MEIKQAKQWLIWRFVGDRKVPFDKWGHVSGSTREEDYVDFETAKEAAKNLAGFQGPAFCFTGQDPWIGIDLDRCVGRGYGIEDWALPILERFSGTYFELSPSLRGVKIYARGKRPVGYPCRTSIDGTDGAIEVYEEGRFFTFTELNYYKAPEVIADCQESIDWLFQTYFPKTPIYTIPNGQSSGLSIHVRAQDYLASCDPALPGGRNAACFRLSGHLAAITDDSGARLSESEVIQLAQAWNSRNPEPMSQAEVERTVKSAIKSGTPRESKLGSLPQFQEDSGVDLSNFSTTKPILKPVSKKQAKDELPIPPGIISDFVDWCLSTSIIEQPEFALAAGIALVGQLASRKICDELGNRTNLYLVCLGSSGAGKEHSRGCVKKLLRHAEAKHVDNFSSGIAILRSMQKHPSLIWLADEFGKMLQSTCEARAPSYLRQQIQFLLSLYGQADQVADFHYSEEKASISIDKPCLSVLGTSTPETFWEAVGASSVEDGFIPRLLVFEQAPTRKRNQLQRGASSVGPPESLVDACRLWGSYQPQQAGNLSAVTDYQATCVPYSQEAWEMRESFADWCNEQTANQMWSRAPQKLCRLALIHAVSRSLGSVPTEVCVDDISWARKIVGVITTRLVVNMRTTVARNDIERAKNKLLEAIRDASPMRMNDLTRRTQWLRRREREEFLTDLIASGDVRLESLESDGGRPVTLIHYVER